MLNLGQVIAAGLGPRVARAWRSRHYPNDRHNAASMVWTQAPQIIRAFDEGVLIKSDAGFWLAIPTPSVPKRGTDGKRINPSNFPEHRYGPLRFVYRTTGPSLLVVEGVRVSARTGRVGRQAKGGSHTKTGRIKSGMTTVVMFLLVPQVKMPRRLDVKQAADFWIGRLPEIIDRHMGG
ncbi:MAG: hypothetical protein HQL76_18075 [Magnetococcales bacterium]|nr:hypothetical protein [Magnetococcales bacterium]